MTEARYISTDAEENTALGAPFPQRHSGVRNQGRLKGKSEGPALPRFTQICQFC